MRHIIRALLNGAGPRTLRLGHFCLFLMCHAADMFLLSSANANNLVGLACAVMIESYDTLRRLFAHPLEDGPVSSSTECSLQTEWGHEDMTIAQAPEEA